MTRILVLLAIATLLSCSSDKGKADAVAIVATSDSTAVVTDSMEVPSGRISLEIVKMGTGHITTTILVNGLPCVFLIDTGGGATLIDKSRKKHFQLKASGGRSYAAGISAATSLVPTTATLQISGHDIKSKDLFLMDISYINRGLRRNHGRQVDGVLGTDFLDKHQAVIDYGKSVMYLTLDTD
ncbi:MAG: aspartyl protease family protein [Prevotella sp.]|nr:aspartyl protease family protein [Prevotella sp.]